MTLKLFDKATVKFRPTDLRIKWGLIFNSDFKYQYDTKMEILSNIL